MNRRTRRLLVGVTVIAVTLIIGRWTVATLADRWWAATISPSAAEFVTRWQLLGFALDAAAILVASGWFAAQALLVARAISLVQVERDVGNLRVREAVPGRFLVLAAVVTGVLLGVITGAGARAWRVPIALAWEGVSYGVRDPVLHEDLGVHVAQVPVWRLAHGFTFTLVVVGLVLAVVLYVAVGGVRREDGRVVVHADARRHLGTLLALLALTLGAGYLLAPYELASAGSATLGMVAVATRVTAMQAMAGACIGVAAMSIAWAVRARHSLVASGWLVLAFGALVERVVVPALASESEIPPGHVEAIRNLEAIAWGMRVDTAAVATTDTVPDVTGVWDEALLARAAERGNDLLLATSPLPQDSTTGAAWLTAVAANPDAPIRFAMVAEPGTRSLPLADPPPDLADARVRPDAPAWRPASGAVATADMGSRIVLAWARQAPGMLAGSALGGVDWHLEPAARAHALVPMATWTGVDLTMSDGRLVWVVQGFVTIDHFPLEQRTTWSGRKVAGAVPAFIAVIDAADGTTRIHADPSADALGNAWARYVGALIEPASSLPADVRRSLVYSRAWFDAQLTVLENDRWVGGRRPGRRSPDDPPEPPVTVWDRGTPVRQAVLEDPVRRAVSAVVTARRVNGAPSLRIDRPDAPGAPANARELERLWTRFIPLQQLRDSARAAGDTVFAGTVRWHLGPAGLAAWQPVVAIPMRGAPTPLWFATAVGPQVGGGRTPAEAWAAGVPRGAAARPVRSSDASILEAARRWMLRADSALLRRDMGEFGRAFDALRNALGTTLP